MSDGSPPPPLLVVCGGRSGVGVTTLSIRLAVALSGQGCRVVLVDADLRRPAVAAACGLTGDTGIADVLAARRDIHEVLQVGPGGVQVLAGRSAGPAADGGEVALQRLLRQLMKLGRHADLIVLDAGSGDHEAMRRFWRAAQEVVLVTTPDPPAVLQACATVKRLAGTTPEFVLRLLVNRASDRRVAENLHHRISEASERFQERNVGLLGCVPTDAKLEAEKRGSAAWAAQHSVNSVSLALDAVAAQLIESHLRAVSVARPRGPLTFDGRNSANLAKPQPGFSPIDV